MYNRCLLQIEDPFERPLNTVTTFEQDDLYHLEIQFFTCHDSVTTGSKNSLYSVLATEDVCKLIGKMIPNNSVTVNTGDSAEIQETTDSWTLRLDSQVEMPKWVNLVSKLVYVFKNFFKSTITANIKNEKLIMNANLSCCEMKNCFGNW